MKEERSSHCVSFVHILSQNKMLSLARYTLRATPAIASNEIERGCLRASKFTSTLAIGLNRGLPRDPRNGAWRRGFGSLPKIEGPVGSAGVY